MADVSQVKLPNGDLYTLKDEGALQLTGGQVTGPVTFEDSVTVIAPTTDDNPTTKEYVDNKFSEVPHNIPYVLQTNTSSVAALTGTTSELTELVDGQSIIYHFLYASKSSGTLNLTLADGTTTGAVNVYYGGSTRLTSHCAAGNDYRLTYHKNIAISGSGSYTGWWVEGNYDTNTYDRVRLSNSFVFSADAAASTICGKSTTGNYIKIVAGSVIDITYPIAWLSTAVTISSATTSTNLYSQYPSCTLRNNVSGWTGTSGAMAYLYGTLSGTALTVTGFTSTPPASDDGNVYIPIGYLYSTYQVNFYCQNIVWWYKDGAFRPYSLYQDLSGYALSADVLTKTNTSAFTPTADYNPATKKYVDDKVAAIDIPEEVFTVTITQDPETGEDVVDKTYEDINAAYNAGKVCVLKASSDICYLRNGPTDAHAPIYFISIYDYNEDGIGYYEYRIDRNSNITTHINYATYNEPEDDILVLNLLTEYGYAAPIADASGNVITENDGTLVLG